MTPYSYENFVEDHQSQFKIAEIPELYWPTLHQKLLQKVYDAGNYFTLSQINYINKSNGEIVGKDWDLFTKINISSSDSTQIFLVDHAWTFDLSNARSILKENNSLLLRMFAFICVDESAESIDEKVEAVLDGMWKYCRLYQLSNAADINTDTPIIKTDIWYILDEVGSSLQHSDAPNVRLAPIFYVPEGLCYSVFWPISDVKESVSLTLDKLPHIADTPNKPYLLLPWIDFDFSDQSSAHSYVFSDEFFAKHRTAELLPAESTEKHNALFNKSENVLKVYTDLPLVANKLNNPAFMITEDKDDANILWMGKHFYDFRAISVDTPHRFINQFPSESVLTVKDLLAALSASDDAINLSGSGDELDVEIDCDVGKPLCCSWYPLTFNLVYEIPQFVACFQRHEYEEDEPEEEFMCSNRNCSRMHRRLNENVQHSTKRKGNSNVWIIKPWNLGRGIGICITDKLHKILRLIDSGPMIASRYLTDPVLFYREDISSWVKFDIRYVVLLRSIEPLQLFVHKVFWLRFANKAFSLDNYDDYSKHFTVMNYRTDELKQIHYTEFIELFEHQYPNLKWENIETKIHQVLINIFKIASISNPPKGLGKCSQSRAMYAVDLLLEWTRSDSAATPDGCCSRIQPQVCEVNFSPDCTRACRYYPNFYNEIFDCLFRDEPVDNIHRLV